MTFKEWWKIYLKDHMSCINYRRDFERCWKEAQKQATSNFVMIETNEPVNLDQRFDNIHRRFDRALAKSQTEEVKDHSENDDFE